METAKQGLGQHWINWIIFKGMGNVTVILMLVATHAEIVNTLHVCATVLCGLLLAPARHFFSFHYIRQKATWARLGLGLRDLPP
jgi:hypothetical protein